MNVSAQPIIFPTSYHRRFLAKNNSTMFINAAPVAVNNKIKAIRARKTRLTLESTDQDYTDIRPLNFGYSGGLTSSRTNFSVITAERLVDRSKDIPLGRISGRRPARASVNNNQSSYLWLNDQRPTGGVKQHYTQSNFMMNTSAPMGSSKNKSAVGKGLDVSSRRNRQLLIDQQDSLTPVESQHKTASKTKPLQISSMKSERKNDSKVVRYYVEDDNEDIVVDGDSVEYLEKAMVKCADWLIKYVFDQKFDKKYN